MNCVINETVKSALEKGKKLDVIARYIRLKYHIQIDIASIRQRVNLVKMNYQL
jgi:hypothetical protein